MCHLIVEPRHKRSYPRCTWRSDSSWEPSRSRSPSGRAGPGWPAASPPPGCTGRRPGHCGQGPPPGGPRTRRGIGPDPDQAFAPWLPLINTAVDSLDQLSRVQGSSQKLGRKNKSVVAIMNPAWQFLAPLTLPVTSCWSATSWPLQYRSWITWNGVDNWQWCNVDEMVTQQNCRFCQLLLCRIVFQFNLFLFCSKSKILLTATGTVWQCLVQKGCLISRLYNCQWCSLPSTSQTSLKILEPIIPVWQHYCVMWFLLADKDNWFCFQWFPEKDVPNCRDQITNYSKVFFYALNLICQKHWQQQSCSVSLNQQPVERPVYPWNENRSDASLPPVVSLTADIFDSADNEISAETAGFLKRGFVTPSLGGACKLNSHNARKYHKNKDQIQGSMKIISDLTNLGQDFSFSTSLSAFAIPLWKSVS